MPQKASETRKPHRRWFGRRPTGVPHDQAGWFGGETQKVFEFAQEEAKRFNHNYIGTEHLLLGLVRDEGSTAGRVLVSLDVQLAKVRSAVEFIIGRGDGAVMGAPGLTPRAKKVLELAQDEARRLKCKRVATEHLLLGLVREGEGIAAGVLESFGVGMDRVRAQVMTAVLVPGNPLPPLPPIAPRRQGVTINQPRPIGPMRANEVVYGLPLPQEMLMKIAGASQRLNRPIDDLMREAIARTWLTDNAPPPETAPPANTDPTG